MEFGKVNTNGERLQSLQFDPITAGLAGNLYLGYQLFYKSYTRNMYSVDIYYLYEKWAKSVLVVETKLRQPI